MILGNNNNTVIYLIPLNLITSIYSNTHLKYFISIVKSVSLVLTALFLIPVLTLLFTDFILYLYRLIAYNTFQSAKIKTKEHRQQLFHTNSYFNFNNYIKNYSSLRSNTNTGRKNSTDSLNSNDFISLIDTTPEVDSINTRTFQQQNGKVFLKRGDSNLNHRRGSDNNSLQHQRSRSVVFSVSN